MSNEDFTPEQLKKILGQEITEKVRLPDFGGTIPKEINPPNFIKQKVGSGGLDIKVLEKAQKLIDNNSVNFRPMAEQYLSQIENVVSEFKQKPAQVKHTDFINRLIAPTMQLKANGGMFHYELVTQISDMFTHFLESLKEIQPDALEVINGFYTALRAIIISEIKGDGGKDGQELVKELESAWKRYNQRQKKV